MATYHELLASEQTLSISKIFRLSWRIFSENIIPIVAVSLIMSLPYYILGFIGRTVKGHHSDSFQVLGMFVLILGFVFYIVGQCALIQFTADIIYGKFISWNAIMAKARARSSSAAITFTMFMVVILLLCLLFVIPAIIFGVFYIFVLESVVLRKLRGTGALRYSKALVSGYWWPVFGALLLITLLELVTGTLIEPLLGYIFGNGVNFLLSAVLDGALQGFGSVVGVLLFLRLEQLQNLTPAEAQTEYEIIAPSCS